LIFPKANLVGFRKSQTWFGLVQEELNSGLPWFQEEPNTVWFQKRANTGMVSRGAKAGSVQKKLKRFGFKRR